MRRSDRLFDIIQRLRTATKPVTAAMLAAELEVTPRTVYRDIATLQARRVPIEGAPGIGYVLRSGFDLPPLMFTIDEVEAIAVGARLVHRLRDPKLQEAAQARARQGDGRGARAAAPAYRRRAGLRVARHGRRCPGRRPGRGSRRDPRQPQALHRLCRRAGPAHQPHHLADRHGLLRRRHPGRRLVRAQSRLPEFPRRAHPGLQGAGRAFRPGQRPAVPRMVGAPQGARRRARLGAMAIDIKPIDPVGRAVLRGRSLGHRPQRSPVGRGGGGDPCRHGPVRRAGVPRPAHHRRPAARLQPPARSARDRRPATSPRPRTGASAWSSNDISNLDKHNEVLARDDRRRLFGLGNQLWHSDSSFKDGAGQVFAAVGPHHPRRRRQHRVRRHARGLRRARRQDQARGART